MGYAIDIDVGGTFSDFFINKDSEVIVVKTPTTRYDLGVCFMRGLEEGARQFNISLEQLLEGTETIRYSTTIGTNSLIERSGPKLGLMTTAGFEDTIYIGRARQWADGASTLENKDLARIRKPDPLIPRNMVVGLRERVDCFGNVVMPLQKEDVLEKVQYLVDNGVRGFIVAFLWSFINPVHEQRVKEIIEEEYPETYLGNMPILLSSEISPKNGEYTRTMTTIVNGYMHQELAEQLSNLGEKLREAGYKKPLLLVHNTGGTKKVSRTKAINTHNAGPVAGLCGSSYLGKIYDFKNIIFTDMGGTSFDIGVVANGELRFYDLIPVIDRWRTQVPTIETISIGAGGGSVGWLNELIGNRLEVGPMSAGSMPGPAAYDQGGHEPTVTDADIVLGYIDPDYYLGGKMRLSAEKSVKAIKDKIAGPLQIDVTEAALMIKKVVDSRMGQEIFKEVALKGLDPREFVLFACGGAGPTHCCGFAPHLDIKRILTSPFSAVFGAFGASTLDVKHIYDKSKRLKLFHFVTQEFLNEYEKFNSITSELQDLAIRDLKLEGFSEKEISLSLELDMKYGGQFHYTRIVSPKISVHSQEDVKAICNAFTQSYSKTYSPEAAFPQGGVDVEVFYLIAHIPIPHYKFPSFPQKGDLPSNDALRGQRSIYWEEEGKIVDTKIYDFSKLSVGNKVDGPAIIEAKDTTFVVSPGWRFTLDQYLNGLIEQQT
jgi:N-methylhydantoinase A